MTSAQPQWRLHGGSLLRECTFGGFTQAIDFVNRVAQVAEAAGQHPDITIRYNIVSLSLVTHDAGGITERDLTLAFEVEALLEQAASE